MKLDYRTGLRQKQQQKQELTMTPKLRQAINLLQLSSLELKDHLAEEMLDNPLLELEEEYKAPGDSYVANNEEKVDYENFVAAELTLEEYLEKQLHLVVANKQEKEIGEEIIGSLDQAGFFTELIEVANRLNVSQEQVQEVVVKVQQLDPAGIAASDVQESLLLQLDRLEDPTNQEQIKLARQIIIDYQEELDKNQISKIARGLKIEASSVQQLVDLIKSLTPLPAEKFKQQEGNNYLEPDVVIKETTDDYLIFLNQTSFPTLHINSYYRKLLKQGADKQSQDYLADKLDSALWLIKSIEQRRQTVYNIVEEIISLQQEFLAKGVKHLQPMTMAQIAERIEMHESTVSRATSNKYIQTPQGLFPFKFLFTAGIDTSQGKVSVVSIKEHLKEVVANEDKHQPLSDRQLSEELETAGIDISRRTVAKYRQELKIPSSRQRKRYD
ncbi:RNA polymerase factor sigma-54 [Halanaerobaculum tunisiense]